MVGVCLTVVSIVHSFGQKIQEAAPWVDDLLAAAAVMFLTACVLSYITIRSRKPARMHRVESAADLVFIAALACMVAVCSSIAWAIF